MGGGRSQAWVAWVVPTNITQRPPNNTSQYDDLRPLLFAFYKSPAKYMFVRDHVCFLPEFLNNYPFKTSKASAFVPQVHS